ncbi:MAG: HAMP domain-containing protein [Chloroflexi bacterium]|nr:HAMP domain-containing protein [Chloroflexota bacterium]
MQQTATSTTEASAHKSKGVFISLAIRLLAAFSILFAIVFGGAYYWFYTFSTSVAMDRLEEDLQVFVTGVAGQINGDDFSDLVENGGTPTEEGLDADQDNALFWDQAAFLNQMTQIDPRAKSIYTYAKGASPNEVVFVTDSLVLSADPDSAARFLQSVVYDPADAEIILAGTQQVELYMTIYEDPNFPGAWVSGYAPIKNSAGQMVGAVGIDFRADYVRQVQSDVRDRFVPAAVISAVLLIGMVYLVSRWLTRPVAALTEAAERIGEGDYEQDLSKLTGGHFHDEINKLAQVFEIMVGKVRQREEKLKKQVAELQIMIDENRRQEQVEQIVDSDFFRDLQKKAQHMRKGFASFNPETPAAATSAPKPEE